MVAARIGKLATRVGQGGRPQGAEEWCSKLRVGSTLGVAYSDSNLVHERILLWPASAGPNGVTYNWAVLTPDGDIYAHLQTRDCLE